MDSTNLKNGKNTKHIIIKRRNKKPNENQKNNLTFFEDQKQNSFNNIINKNEEKNKNKKNSNFVKLFQLQRPKIKINLLSIDNNNIFNNISFGKFFCRYIILFLLFIIKYQITILLKL